MNKGMIKGMNKGMNKFMNKFMKKETIYFDWRISIYFLDILLCCTLFFDGMDGLLYQNKQIIGGHVMPLWHSLEANSCKTEFCVSPVQGSSLTPGLPFSLKCT